MHLVFFSLSNRLVGEAFNIMFQLCGNEVIIKVIALAERGKFSLTHELFSLWMLFWGNLSRQTYCSGRHGFMNDRSHQAGRMISSVLSETLVQSRAKRLPSSVSSKMSALSVSLSRARRARASSLGSGEVFIVKDVYGFGSLRLSSVDNRFDASVRLATFLVLGDHLTGPELGRSGYQNSSSASCSFRTLSVKLGENNELGISDWLITISNEEEWKRVSFGLEVSALVSGKVLDRRKKATYPTHLFPFL
ncbi:hypothetical protein F2Q70_00013572 [Brassica cretica]|uniref:Uncharacterized protein n=1 Tax=Brassica cretica TaxID=69181 RepID=A0A8S9M1K9_BRACR|nr:hypothetical protein F2Q70_00013572 [Brassica cretica]